MSMPDPMPKKTLADRLGSVDRTTLFGILILVATIPLFFTLSVPNKPFEPTIDLFAKLMSLPEGSSVIIQTDWTVSTRGESAGEMEALLRILMRRNIKFAMYSAADPQAPQVARNVIMQLNEERTKATPPQRLYERWNDWVDLGYFPNAEATNNAMAADLSKAFGGRSDVTPQGSYANVFTSPVLAKVRSVKDVPLVIIVTASSTFNVIVERLSGKVPLAATVTGVMGPESQIYHSSGQIVGLAAGLKGVFDLETMMEYGLNTPGPDGKVVVPSDSHPAIPGFPGQINFAKGKRYYPTLHATLFLLILVVVIGNIGMILARKNKT